MFQALNNHGSLLDYTADKVDCNTTIATKWCNMQSDSNKQNNFLLRPVNKVRGRLWTQ